MARQHATRNQVVEVYRLLAEHSSREPDSALIDYEDGWDDEAIALAVGCSPTTVAKARKEGNFGYIRKPEPPEPEPASLPLLDEIDRLAALESRLSLVETTVAMRPHMPRAELGEKVDRWIANFESWRSHVRQLTQRVTVLEMQRDARHGTSAPPPPDTPSNSEPPEGPEGVSDSVVRGAT